MIRIGQIDDLPAIVAIYNQSIAEGKATADLQEVAIADRFPWFNAHTMPKRPLWVYETDRVIGWCSLSDFYGRVAYQNTVEISIYIDFEFHRQGLASILLDQAIEYSKTIGVEVILAFVFEHNEASMKLFQRRQFEVWGHLPRVANIKAQRINLCILGKSLLG